MSEAGYGTRTGGSGASSSCNNSPKPRSSPTCARCHNHGHTIILKGHKRYCKYRKCCCEKCRLTDKRQHSKAQRTAKWRAKILEEQCSREGEVTKSAHRNCARCANHGIMIPLKGHKRKCVYSTCSCSKCTLILKRQQRMKQQTSFRRAQAQDEQHARHEGITHQHPQTSDYGETLVWLPGQSDNKEPGSKIQCLPVFSLNRFEDETSCFSDLCSLDDIEEALSLFGPYPEVLPDLGPGVLPDEC